MADANISIGADASAFSSTLQQVVKNTNESLSEIGKAFLGFQGLSALGRGIASAFSGLTGPVAELENVSASLGGGLGNESEADKLARGLRDIAINGVVEFEDLHRAARPLANVCSDADYNAVGRAYIGAATKQPAR